MQYKVHFSIGFLSAAIITFQLALMQILSIIQWYHFAYMVISVAMLGFGAAGTVLAIFRQPLIRHSEVILPVLMIATGIAMSLVTGISQSSFIRFDSYLLFAEYTHIGNLLLTYLLFLIPFFLGALAIGLIFVRQVNEIGKIYFANLVGSGVGGVLALVLVWFFFPKQLPAIISLLPVIAGMIIIPRKKKIFIAGLAVIALSISAWKIISPPHLLLSQYKDLSKTLLLPGATIKLEKASPHGLIQAVSSQALRYAPGLSLTAQKTAKVNSAVFINGDWFGVVANTGKVDSSMILDYTTFALPYIMSQRKKVLILKAGTGMDVMHALKRGADKVVAVESNPVVISALKKELASENDSLFYQPQVHVHTVEPRTFLLMDTAHYDLINLPVVGTFGGSAGLFAMQEQFIYTKEAFFEMWTRLNEGGIISVTAWIDYPLRNPLKILATIAEVLEELNIKNPHHHIAAIRSWGTISFVFSKSPIQEQEIINIKEFCEEMLFDPALLPDLKPEERTAYNQLQDSSFFIYADTLLTAGRKKFYEDYDFNIKPATDNKPYFSQFIRWKSLNHLAGFFGNRSIPFFELGYLLIVVTLIQITIVSFVLILLPLFKTGWKGKNRWQIILYFGGIGLGYMFVEMVFIQRFILYFGNPVYAASAVITSLLLFSGIGSFMSGNFINKSKTMLMIFSLIVILLFVYSFSLTPILRQTVHLSLPFKLIIIFLVMAPLAFCMGMPFPAGLSHVSKTNAQDIPWAWGLNGCVSVISTALAMIVAVEWGFIWVMLLAALAYCVPLIVQMRWMR